MQVLFVGCGNMGGAIVSGMLQSCNFKNTEISAILPNNEADIQRTKELYGIKVYTEYPSDIKFDAVLLAVKPQILPEILPYYRAAITDLNTIIISIAAGRTTKYLAGFFRDHAIIRTMPNINALAGKAITIGYTNKPLLEASKHLVEKIFSSTGKYFWVDNEDQIDAVTAISGSGPAYFFQFVEYMTSAGMKLGLPPEIAKELATETFIGSAALLEKTGDSPENLRKAVTSPAGTTAAALEIFNKSNNLNNLIDDAIRSAYTRAKQLSE